MNTILQRLYARQSWRRKKMRKQLEAEFNTYRQTIVKYLVGTLRSRPDKAEDAFMSAVVILLSSNSIVPRNLLAYLFRMSKRLWFKGLLNDLPSFDALTGRQLEEIDASLGCQ